MARAVSGSAPDQRRRTQPGGAVVGQQRPVRDQLVPVWRPGKVGGLPGAEAEHQVAITSVRPPGKSHMVRPSRSRHRRSSTSRYTPAW